jgi:hypothetical protein
VEWVFVVILVGLFGAKFVISRRGLRQANQRLRQENQRARGDEGNADGGAPDHLPGRGRGRGRDRGGDGAG